MAGRTRVAVDDLSRNQEADACDGLTQAPVVASAVLVSAGHVLQWNAEIVKRWSNEIQEAVQSKNGMVQVRQEMCNH